MIPFKNLLAPDPGSSQAIYAQLANGLIRMIRSGMLRPGTKLPSVREMVEQMGERWRGGPSGGDIWQVWSIFAGDHEVNLSYTDLGAAVLGILSTENKGQFVPGGHRSNPGA